jgi:cytochrome c oxidase subunit 2
MRTAGRSEIAFRPGERYPRVVSATQTAISVPAPVDTQHEYDHLFSIYVPIAGGVFAVVLVVLIVAVVRARRRAPDRASQRHENNPLELTYALLLGCVVAFLLLVTFTAEHRVDGVASAETPRLVVDVTGAQWEWSFRYPTYGITRRSGTVGHQALVVPTNEAIRFDLTSQDVIHSFWIPELDFKRDLFPGNVQRVTLTFAHPGTFPGQCAEFCGLRHADMVFTVRAVSPAVFEAWARSGARAALR